MGIVFQCPKCNATHERGFVNGVDTFRCLSCGYQGHGFHSDPAIDAAVFAEHVSNNAINRSLGIAEVPLGVDPLNGPG
jgi:Zn ribbon nucleic-acid-binding protein